MARRVLEYTVVDEGRDKGKVFILTEMSASNAEEWALQVMSVMANSGIDIPQDVADAGLAGLATMAVPMLLKAPYYSAKPLLDQMMGCITVMPDPARPEVQRKLVETDIEEVVTRLKLRREVLDLHLGFSVTAAILALAAVAKIKSNGPSAPTSPELSPSPPAADTPATPN